MSYHINYGLGTFLFSSGRSFEGAFFLPVPTTSLCYNLLTSLSHFWICLWSSTLALLDSWYFCKRPLYLYAVAIMILFLLSRLDSIALLGQLLILWFSNIQREWAAITICLVRVCLLFGGRANCLETFHHIPENSLKFILTMPSWKFSGTSVWENSEFSVMGFSLRSCRESNCTVQSFLWVMLDFTKRRWESQPFLSLFFSSNSKAAVASLIVWKAFFSSNK